jgi:DNA-binding response OmpR family regulator
MDSTRHLLRGRNILVADSEPHVRRELSSALAETGVRVYQARHGDEAVEIISRVRVSALVLDSRLPSFGGLETIRIMRTFGADVPPWVLVAEELTRELRMEALDRDAASVVPKPVNVEVVLEILESIFSRGRSSPRPNRG